MNNQPVGTTKEIKYFTTINGLKLIAIVLIVIGLGFFAVNQTLAYYYKAQLLYSPCTICLNLNPGLESCFIGKQFINNITIDIGEEFT